MRHETHFGQRGFYEFMVRQNILLHRESIATGRDILTPWLQRRAPDRPIRVLDLACGGEPLAIAALMQHFSAYTFDYTGIDVHPDQIAHARTRFAWPSNVHPTLHEGNAWQPAAIVEDASCDLVFSGLHFHHGTPEELACVGRSLNALMTSDSLLLVHDLFRPATLPYRRRPARDPQTHELLAMLTPAHLAEHGIATRYLPQEGTDPTDWRETFIAALDHAMRAHGADDAGRAMNHAHVRARDYPLSTAEFSQIFTEIGFDVMTNTYESSGHPLQKYFAMLSARKN